MIFIFPLLYFRLTVIATLIKSGRTQHVLSHQRCNPKEEHMEARVPYRVRDEPVVPVVWLFQVLQ